MPRKRRLVLCCARGHHRGAVELLVHARVHAIFFVIIKHFRRCRRRRSSRRSSERKSACCVADSGARRAAAELPCARAPDTLPAQEAALCAALHSLPQEVQVMTYTKHTHTREQTKQAPPQNETNVQKHQRRNTVSERSAAKQASKRSERSESGGVDAARTRGACGAAGAGGAARKCSKEDPLPLPHNVRVTNNKRKQTSQENMHKKEARKHANVDVDVWLTVWTTRGGRTATTRR